MPEECPQAAQKPPIKLGSLIKQKKNRPLTNEQYVYARYAGFESDELANANQGWRKANNHLIFVNIQGPCTARQVLKLSKHGVQASEAEDTFIDAKSIIVDIILSTENDERFNIEHQKIVEHNTTKRREREQAAKLKPEVPDKPKKRKAIDVEIKDKEIVAFLKDIEKRNGILPKETVEKALILNMEEYKGV